MSLSETEALPCFDLCGMAELFAVQCMPTTSAGAALHIHGRSTQGHGEQGAEPVAWQLDAHKQGSGGRPPAVS